MKIRAILFGLLGLAAAQSASAAAAANTWYGDFNGGPSLRVTHLRCFLNSTCYFQVEANGAVAATDMFWFDPATSTGKNWSSLVATAKSTGQAVEFHTTSAVSGGNGWNVDVIGLR